MVIMPPLASHKFQLSLNACSTEAFVRHSDDMFPFERGEMSDVDISK